MKRQVFKFNDIKGMLNDDEMKGVVGGCGTYYDGHVWVSGDPTWNSGGPSGPPMDGAYSYLSNFAAETAALTSGNQGSSSMSGFVAWANSLPQGTYTTAGDGSYTYNPVSGQADSTGRVPIITVGPVGSLGVSQEMQYATWTPVAGFGSTLAVAASGSVGFEQNSDGQWVAAAGFSITPPAAFTHANAAGNVYVYVNGTHVGDFSMHDTRDGSSVIYSTGTIPISGNFTMPSSFNGQGIVTFVIRTGATEFDGNDTYHANNSEQSISLVLAHP